MVRIDPSILLEEALPYIADRSGVVFFFFNLKVL